jgi:hypothetical protein
VVIEVNSTNQAKIVFEIKIINVLTKLNCATAIAFLPFESRPAIEKNIGARAEEPKPAKKIQQRQLDMQYFYWYQLIQLKVESLR